MTFPRGMLLRRPLPHAAFDQTWAFLFGDRLKTILNIAGPAAIGLVITLWIEGQKAMSEEIGKLLLTGTLASVVWGIFVFLAHLFYLTPKAAMAEQDRKIEEGQERERSLQSEIDHLRLRISPRMELIIKCGPSVEDSVVQPVDSQEYLVGGAKLRDFGRWFRIVFRANRPQPVEDCVGCITDVIGPTGAHSFDGAYLTWAPGTPQNPPKSITQTPSEKLDVLRISETGVVVFGTPCGGSVWNYRPVPEIFAKRGDYDLTVVVNGKDVLPFVITLKFQWRDNWNDSLLTLTDISREPKIPRPRIQAQI